MQKRYTRYKTGFKENLMMDPLLLRLIIGFAVNLLFGVIAFMKEMIDDKGLFIGVLLFTLIYAFLDWQAYAVVAAYFFISGIAIDMENRNKANKGAFELYKAKKSLSRVLGRSLAGAIFASLFFFTDRQDFKLAFVASYAEAVFDTISSKLGKILSKDAFLAINFKIVPHGTPGGISIHGTLFGGVAALIVSAIGILTGLININELWIVLIGALAGSTVDTFLNAYSSRKQRIPNEFINFFSSMIAGLVCIWILWFLTTVAGIQI